MRLFRLCLMSVAVFEHARLRGVVPFHVFHFIFGIDCNYEKEWLFSCSLVFLENYGHEYRIFVNHSFHYMVVLEFSFF